MDGFFLETVNAVVLRRMMKRNEKDGEYHEVADSHYLCIDRIKYFRGGTVSDANAFVLASAGEAVVIYCI